MSSNIEVQRICQYCGNEFTARTTVTLYCGDICSKRAYKARIKAAKIEASNRETQRIINKPFEDIKVKEFLTVKEVARLLNCSVRSAYYSIQNGSIKATNLGKRITRVKRSEIDKLFEQPQNVTLQLDSQCEKMQVEISDCYTLTEIKEKYSISDKALYELIKRNNLPKIKKGWFVYIPKTLIDNILQ